MKRLKATECFERMKECFNGRLIIPRKGKEQYQILKNLLIFGQAFGKMKLVHHIGDG